MFRRTLRFVFLSRPAMLPLSVSVPIAGALTLFHPLSFSEFIGLGFVGVFAHFFGFTLNDIIDFRLDSTVPTRRRSPLVAGKVSQLQAWIFAVLQIPLAFLTYAVLLNGTVAGTVVLAVSIGVSMVYNLWSKWGRLPRLLPEIALAVSIGLLCLSGTLLKSDIVLPRTLAFCGSVSLVLLLVNSVPSGLKDLQTDAAFGARSFVMSTSSYVDDSGRLVVSRALTVYSFALQSLIAVSVLLLIALFQPGWLIVFLAVLLILYASLHLRQILTARTPAELRRAVPFLGGFYNYFAVSLFVFAGLPAIIQVIYALLLLRFISRPWRIAFGQWRNRYHVVLD